MFLIKYDELLEWYNAICDNASNTIKNGFDSESVCNKRYIKTKIVN